MTRVWNLWLNDFFLSSVDDGDGLASDADADPDKKTPSNVPEDPKAIPWNIQSGKNDEAIEIMLVRNLRWKYECAEKLGVTLNHARLQGSEKIW